MFQVFPVSPVFKHETSDNLTEQKRILKNNIKNYAVNKIVEQVAIHVTELYKKY